MNFENEMRERMTGVEKDVKHVISLLTENNLPEMKTDVTSLKQTQKNLRMVGWSTLSAFILAIITYLFKGLPNVRF